MLGRRRTPTPTERLASDDGAVTALFDAAGPLILAGADRRVIRASAALAAAIGGAPPAGITLGEIVEPADRDALRDILSGQPAAATLRFTAAKGRSFVPSLSWLGDGGLLLRLEPIPQADPGGAAALAHDAANSLAVALALAEQQGADASITAAILAARALLRRLAGAPGQAVPAGPVLLAALVTDSLPALRALLSPSITVVVDDGAPSLAVHLAPESAARILLNLAANTRAAMPNGGVVTLRTGQMRLLQDQTIHGEGLPAGRYGVLTVEDTGPGIPPDRLARLFTPGTSFTSGGAGLGLASSRALLREAGGAISIESRAGQGTTVKLWLPACGSPTPGKPRTPAPTATATGAARILLVEDEPSLRRALALSLGAAGYDVVSAGSAEEALIAPAADLLVADMNLPGEDGLRLLARLRQRRPGVKAVILSGAVVTVPEGLDDVVVLAKPAAGAELLKAIKEALLF